MRRKNRRGLATLPMMAVFFIMAFVVGGLGLVVYSFSAVDDALNQDVEVGQVNLAEVNDATFGKVSDGLKGNADTIGMAVLLMMCLGMILNGFIFGKKYPRFFLVVDILLLIFTFILAVYIAQAYELLIDGADIITSFKEDIPNSSSFILNLPTIVGTLGAAIIIFSYAGLRKGEEGQEVNVYGY